MIGEEVRRRREELGLTGAQLAERAGMAPSAVSQIETGKRSPSSNSLVKLAEALDMEVGQLFPKAQAPLQLELEEQRGASEERRSSILPEALIATIDKWIDIISEPGTNNREGAGIMRAAGTLGDSIEDLANEESWDSLPGREQHQIIRVMEKITEVFQRHAQTIEDEVLEEESRQQREKIREWTRRISA